MFSYLTGKKIIAIQTLNHCESIITYDKKQYLNLNKTPNIFNKLNKNNWNSCTVGWHLPFEKIYEKDLITAPKIKNNNNYFFEIYKKIALFYFLKPLNKILNYKINFLNTIVLSYSHKHNIYTYKKILFETKQKILNQKINFSFIHMSIPHSPIIYDYKKLKFSTSSNTYSDQLALVDISIGEIINHLKKYNEFDNSTIILTSDHWFRTELWTKDINPQTIKISDKELENLSKRTYGMIPLLIKLPNQKQSISYEKAINALSLHYLVLDLFKDKIKSEKDLVEWFDNFQLPEGVK